MATTEPSPERDRMIQELEDLAQEEMPWLINR
jgi:hypothetical protein